MTEKAHDDAQAAREGRPAAHETQRDDGARAVASAAARTGSVAGLSRASVSSLQRSAGSRAVAQALGTAGLAVQRHAEGEELPEVEEDRTEIQNKATAAVPPPAPPESPPTGAEPERPAETTPPAAPAPPTEEPAPADESSPSAPAATRTPAVEATERAAATTAGTAFTAAQRLTPGAQGLASAQAVLQGAYGGLKTIVTGTIEILRDQPACAAKYDEVCIRDGVRRPDGSAWRAGDCARDDAAQGVLTQGFAWRGVIYVNGATTLVTATTHEMLHVNAHATFRATVGETFNEGATEYLARKALRDAGVTVPLTTAYPTQVQMLRDLVALVGEDTLLNAYFSDPQVLVTTFEARGTGTFAALKVAAEALNATAVAAALVARTAATAPSGP